MRPLLPSPNTPTTSVDAPRASSTSTSSRPSRSTSTSPRIIEPTSSTSAAKPISYVGPAVSAIRARQFSPSAGAVRANTTNTSGQPSPSRSTFVASAHVQPSGTGPAPRSPHAGAGVGLACGTADGAANTATGRVLGSALGVAFGAVATARPQLTNTSARTSHFGTTLRVLCGVWRVIRVVNAQSATPLTLLFNQSRPAAEPRSGLVVSLLAAQPLVAHLSAVLNLGLRPRHAQGWWFRSSRHSRSSLIFRPRAPTVFRSHRCTRTPGVSAGCHRAAP